MTADERQEARQRLAARIRGILRRSHPLTSETAAERVLGSFICPHCGERRKLPTVPDHCPGCGSRLAPLPRCLTPAQLRAREAAIYGEE